MQRISNLLERLLQPKSGGLAPAHARYILSLDFTDQEKRRYLKLSRKAQEGKLTATEESELDDFLTVNAMLIMMQSKARRSKCTRDHMRRFSRRES